MKYKGFKNKKRSIISGEIEPVEMPKVIHIKEAENGYIVSCYYNEDYIAKTVDEAMEYAKKAFKAEKEEKEED